MLNLASMKGTNSFGLSIIEYILEETDGDRLKSMIEKGIILHPKECLTMDVNMKPLVLDLIKNENLFMANKMIELIEKLHIGE